MKTIFFDVEVDAQTHQPLEVAVCDDTPGSILFSSMVRNATPISDTNDQKGLSSENLSVAPEKPIIERILCDLFADNLLVSWNARFDKSFFPLACSRAKSSVCAMQRFAAYAGDFVPDFNGFRWQKLGTAVELIGSNFQLTQHRAAGDAIALQRVWQWMEENPIRQFPINKKNLWPWEEPRQKLTLVGDRND